MKLCILAYEGVDIWDIIFVHDIFSHIKTSIVEIVTPHGGEIKLKDTNLVIGGTKSMADVESLDVLWVCQGERSLEKLIKDDYFKINFHRLVNLSDKVVTIGAASMLCLNLVLNKYKATSCSPYFKEKFIKLGGNYRDNMIFSNEKFLSSSTRLSCIYLSLILVHYYYGSKARDEVFKHYNFDNNLISKYGELSKVREKNLISLYKQVLKNKPLTIKNKPLISEDAVVFHLGNKFNPLEFGVIYSLLSNYRGTELYITGNEKNYVEDSSFYIKSNFDIANVKKISHLVLCQNPYKDYFLDYSKVELIKIYNAISGADKIVALSGIKYLMPKIKRFGNFNSDKWVTFENFGFELMWLKNNIANLTNDFQKDIILSDYYI